MELGYMQVGEWPPFSVISVNSIPTSKVRSLTVGFQSNVPSDYSASIVFRAMPGNIPNPPTQCNWTTEIPLHARVVADGGSVDAADTNDGGADLAPDAS